MTKHNINTFVVKIIIYITINIIYTCTCTIYYYTTGAWGWGNFRQTSFVCVKTSSLPRSMNSRLICAAVKRIYVQVYI